MKNILVALLAIFTLLNIDCVYAISSDNIDNTAEEEITLDIDNEFDVDSKDEQAEEPDKETSDKTTTEEKSLKETLKKVYNLEVEKYDKPAYLFKEALTHKYKESSPLESTLLRTRPIPCISVRS